jgi:agmatine deiminase
MGEFGLMRTGGQAVTILNRRVFMGTAVAAIVTARSALGLQPKPHGYFAPAEDSLHARTWMCWPSTPTIYGGPARYFESVQETLGRLAAAIVEHEPVSMLVQAKHQALAARLCGPKVKLVDVQTDDMWARDSGPVFLRNHEGQIAALDLNFNGWGGKQQHRLDKQVSASVAKQLGCPYFRSEITGEGGGLEYDGDGTLLLTESCWLNDNRNPGWTREEIEAELKVSLGVEKLIWLPGVRGRDITDGHIDGSVRIVRPGLLITGGYPGDTSEWGRALAESKAILSKATDARGRSFEIVDIPSAVDVRSTREDVFTGYANYYVGNGAVYTPSFGDARADARAVDTLTRLFTGRRVVSLEVDRIYENGGGIHCVTQQQPAV